MHQINDVLAVCGPRLSLNIIESLLLLRELPYSVRSSGDVLRTGLLAPLEKSSVWKKRTKKKEKKKRNRSKRKKKGRMKEERKKEEKVREIVNGRNINYERTMSSRYLLYL